MARDPYEVVLADLRAKRDDIDRLIRSLEAFRPAGLATPAAPTAPPPKAPPAFGGPLQGLSIVDGAQSVLKERGAPMGNGDIADAIQAGGLAMNSAEPANTVSSVLHRAWENGGDIVRVGRGMWGLKEWYPGQDMSKRSAEKTATGSDAPHFPPPPLDFPSPKLPPPPPPPPAWATPAALTRQQLADDDIPF